MALRIIKTIFLLALFAGTIGYASKMRIRWPASDQSYSPMQPIAFSHRVHSGELQIDCQYCHTGVETSRHAGIPATNTCMNCHRHVTAAWEDVELEAAVARRENREPRVVVSDELAKLYSAVGFDPVQKQQKQQAAGSGIEWVRVHDLPDFVVFDHRRHVNAGVTCVRCHGEVETMNQIVQVSNLTMGWCVNCHRDVNSGNIAELEERSASIDCGACHY